MTRQRKFLLRTMTVGLFGTLTLGGCTSQMQNYFREETAQRIAAPVWMVKRKMPAGDFTLLAYERIHAKGDVGYLYIEGEESLKNAGGSPIGSDTPDYPIALHLAARDDSKNVLYLARPCQFTTDKCDSAYTQEKSFTPEVIESYNAAIDDMVKRYHLRGVHVIGHGGGGTIALILATTRKDILSVRTVAGILDPEAQSTLTGGAPYAENTLSPLEYSENLQNVPQYHFIGGKDTLVPPAVLHSYLQSMPPSPCVRSMMVQEATHEEGWADKWAELKALPVNCFGAPATVGDADAQAIEVETDLTPIPSAEELFDTSVKGGK